MLSATPGVRIVGDAEGIFRVAAGEFVRLAVESAEAKGRFTAVLSGGSTPKGLYLLLADPAKRSGIGWSAVPAGMPWDKTHFFWGDERHVPAGHPESNFRMAQETLLSKVPVPPMNVHRIRTEKADACEVAEDYERGLCEFFHLGGRDLPRFDLVLLGMGADGHTASLFPGTDAIHERKRLVVASWVEKLKAYRVTLTPLTLNNASAIIFLVAGADKAEIVREVLEGPHRPDLYPAQLINPTQGTLLWLIDKAASCRLSLGDQS